MPGSSIVKHLQSLNQRISAACERSGRAPSSVNLLAVSKLQSVAKIREAVQAGHRDFAENYVQEALPKVAQIPDVRWHFIGRLQSNKVKLLGGQFFAIHSVDRLQIARALHEHSLALGRPQNIFLQYNVAQESSKGGADRAELLHLLQFAKSCSHLRVLGLMVMPPPESSSAENRHYFRRARETLVELRGGLSGEEREDHPLNELSMGTSQDFEAAIAEGATWVRIGTQIFGERKKEERA